MSPCRAPFNMFAVLRCACRAEERMKNSYVFLSPTLGAKRSTGWLAVFALTAICALGVTRDSFEAQKPATLPAATTVDFARDIQPILERRCQACHGLTNATKGLRLDQRAAAMQGGESGPAIIPGNSERSLIIRRLLGLDGLSRMPKSGDPLTADQIALIRSWIDQGAHWPRRMRKYAAWVIDALNRDMPFDQFAIEQIAGDMLPDATPEQIVAGGFHRNAMTNEEGGIDPEEALYEVLVDRVNTTATVWLGTTLGCAQCHDHKYDPLTQKDYYRMMAFFANSAYDVRTFGDGTRFFEAQIDLPTPEQETKRTTIQKEVDRLTETLNTQTPELDAAQAEWEATMRQEPAAAWTVLTPERVTANGGVVLTP